MSDTKPHIEKQKKKNNSVKNNQLNICSIAVNNFFAISIFEFDVVRVILTSKIKSKKKILINQNNNTDFLE